MAGSDHVPRACQVTHMHKNLQAVPQPEFCIEQFQTFIIRYAITMVRIPTTSMPRNFYVRGLKSGQFGELSIISQWGMGEALKSSPFI